MGLLQKYIKPKSLTWLASALPLLADWAKAVSLTFGATSPHLLINAGLVGIGLRGAVKP